MARKDYVKRATTMMEKFFSYAESFDTLERIRRNVDTFRNNNKNYSNLYITNGSARVVLICSDYVVKWDYNEKNVRRWGGCEDELKIYNRAVKDGYGHLFAAITKITIKGKNFYVMPRINTIGIDLPFFWNRYLKANEVKYISEIIKIDDIHDYNWGLYKYKTVLFDYAYHHE